MLNHPADLALRQQQKGSPPFCAAQSHRSLKIGSRQGGFMGWLDL